jgi:hypothetical protein
MLPILPEILISKIMLMREPHPLAKMISTNWSEYEQSVYAKCNDGLYDDDYLMTVKGYAFRNKLLPVGWEVVPQDVRKVSITSPERLQSIQTAAHNKDWNEYYGCFTLRELTYLGW